MLGGCNGRHRKILHSSNQHELVALLEDAAISGGTADRPRYQAMLAAARRRQFAIIIVEVISRLWRNRAEFGARSAEFEDFGDPLPDLRRG